MSVADILGFGPKREYRNNADGTISVLVTANRVMIPAAETREIVLTSEQFERMQDWLHGGKLIQDALPDLTVGQRETLMSGL